MKTKDCRGEEAFLSMFLLQIKGLLLIRHIFYLSFSLSAVTEREKLWRHPSTLSGAAVAQKESRVTPLMHINKRVRGNIPCNAIHGMAWQMESEKG